MVYLADDFNAITRSSGQPRQQIAQWLRGSLHSRRNDSACDHARFQQTQVIASKVEDLGNRRNVGGGAEIDAGQANDRLIDDAEPGLDRRTGLREAIVGPADRKIDGDVDDPRALRKVHTEEEDVAPAAVREVHPDGCGLAQDRESRIAGKKLGTKAERIVECVAGPEHPLVPAHAAHAATNLIG